MRILVTDVTCRNTARLVWRLVQAGCPLSITATRDERSRAQAFTAHR